MPKVYIVLLNYNGWKDTIECLESVLKLNYPNYQVIVVDNSPDDASITNIENWASGKSFEKIKSELKQFVYPLTKKPIDCRIVSEKESTTGIYDDSLLIIKAEKNLGFSAGNNIGLRYAQRKGDFGFCWLLNNDTVVHSDALYEQIKYFNKKNKDRIGILGSKILHYFQPNIIQSIGGSFSSKFFISKQLGEGCPISTPKEKFKAIDYVVGASMLVPRRFLQEVGLLSEEYFLYYEELDWVYRGKEKKWTIDWCENSLVYHKEGGSIGSSANPKKRSAFSESNNFKSRHIFVKKFFKKRKMYWVTSVLIIGNRLKRLQFNLAHRFVKIMFSE